jgi:hypothetical protein
LASKVLLVFEYKILHVFGFVSAFTEKAGSGTAFTEKAGSGTTFTEKAGSGTAFTEKAGSGTAFAKRPDLELHSQKGRIRIRSMRNQKLCLYYKCPLI